MEKKKTKVLIYVPSFTIGGTMASLSALLSAIDVAKVDVDVYSRSHLGPCRQQLKNCHVLEENIWLSTIVRSRGRFYYLLSILFQSIIRVCKRIGIDLTESVTRRGGLRINSKRYDAVIAYQESVAQYVRFIPARKRIAWVHCDYERLVSERPSEKRLDFFEPFDAIVCVSKTAKLAFESVFPSLSSKTKYIYNIVDFERIRSQAGTSKPVDASFLTDRKIIISVGRFDDVKQFDLIPSIAARIKKITNKPFRWYIVGAVEGGKNEQTLSERIKENHSEEDVIVYPSQTEVYPYIAKADVLVNTSRSETFSMVVFEAKALGVIPVMNDIPIAYEVIQNAKDGYIVSLDNMPRLIATLLNSDSKMDLESWDNEQSLNKFYELIG